jgi:mitochondrial import inner membrane translocase subunit TIM44
LFSLVELFDLKTKYDESDNTLVRATRVITDKFTSLFGGMFSQTEMSNVVTEITKMDPTFETDKFLKFIQFEVIPNILESISRQDLDILKDWCTDTAFTQLSTPITASKQLNYRYETQVLDVHHVDVSRLPTRQSALLTLLCLDCRW